MDRDFEEEMADMRHEFDEQYDGRGNSIGSFHRGSISKRTAFEIEEPDDRLHLKIDSALASELAELIFEAGTNNKAILAIAHQLRNLNN